MPAVVTGGVITGEGRRTPTYTKPMLGRAGESPRELNRLDIKNRTPTPAGAEDRVIELLEQAWPRFDALIVLDQVSEADCGVVTRRVRERLADMAKTDPYKFVLADSRERIGAFRNVLAKPNYHECLRAIDPDLSNVSGTPPTVEEATRRLEAISGRAVFCTSGQDGIYLAGYASVLPGRVMRVPAYPVTGPIDIVGAGDSTSAGIASALAAGATYEQAAAFGNLVASITIRQIGTTGTASPEQIRQRWREVRPTA
jgi:sugar/nucleoside kinase (ribokinase family)